MTIKQKWFKYETGIMYLKRYPTIYSLQEIHFNYNDTGKLKVKEQKKDISY